MMKYESTSLPEKVQKYLEEIYNDEDLCEAFYDCDVEIYDEEWVKDLEEDESWLEEMMGPGESTYHDIKPFARDGSGALWVVLDDELIGYIGTEGECGIVARNIDEFMNFIAVWRWYLSDCWDVDVLGSEEEFLSMLRDPERLEQPEEKERNDKAFDGMIERHGFTRDPKKLYEMVTLGMTTKPFFMIKATDEDYVDSSSLLRSDDGQEVLEQLSQLIEK
ncbi:MAG: hypothetical protein K6F51_00180 [Acetatifactor sp.]|nr:hypothetical protein [Acetatifactor sp.]